jgi:hypothetical protein
MKYREHHPAIGFGLFLIVLGLSLLVATNDLLNLGSVERYFTWQTAMIFIGLLLLVNLRFVGGLALIAGGVWFMLDKFDYDMPYMVRTFYWPAVVILIGLGFIISSVFRKSGKNI